MRLIKFITDKLQHPDLGQPRAIKELVPEWYRLSESTFIDSSGKENAGLKKCAPYLDALVVGYAVVTPFDIYVAKKEDGSLDIRWNGPPEFQNFIDERPKALGEKMPRPAGHAPNHLVWASPWGFKLPRGYSAILCHPLNRQDLPFTTTAGIIDSDKFWANGNLPFFIREDFTGVIPAGTPYVQIIPYKREKWTKVINQALQDHTAKQGWAVRQKGRSYKNKLWQRKEFK
jgi:hypothetical protein